MRRKREDVDYSELIARAVEEEQTETETGMVMTSADNGVDYEAEYRRQTGKDLETGEYVTQ